MAAARYWRIVGIETYAGGDLELSELHLYGNSGRLDAAATLTSTIAPTAGTLAALQDDTLGTTCRFAADAVRAGGFAIAWDFGAGNTADAVGLRLGASADQSVFMAGCALQYSTDGAQWEFWAGFARYAWPGVSTYTVPPAVGDQHFDKVALLLHCDGANGSTTFTDSSPQPSTITSVGGLALSSAQAKFGGSSLKFINDSAKYITAPAAKFAFLTDLTTSYTAEAWIYPTTARAENIFNLGQNYDIGAFFSVDQAADLKVSARVYRSSGTYGSFSGVSATAMTLNAWNHVAVCYDAVTQKIQVFINGIGGTAGTKAAGTYGAQTTYPLTFGRYAYVYTSAWESSAYHDEVRITKGVARYTADFAPPTEPFLGAGGSDGTVFVSPTLHTAANAVQIAASTPVPAFSTRRAPALTLARDVEVGGPGTIYGTTKTKGTPNVPTKARVVLLHQRSKLPVRETWSDPVTGAFFFTGIDTSQQFLALAEDAEGHFRPVAANRLTPEVP